MRVPLCAFARLIVAYMYTVKTGKGGKDRHPTLAIYTAAGRYTREDTAFEKATREPWRFCFCTGAASPRLAKATKTRKNKYKTLPAHIQKRL